VSSVISVVNETVERHPMRLLGVDPGTEVLGWGVVTLEKSPKLIACGVLRAKRRETPPQRLAHMADGLAEVIREQRPDRAAVEKAFFGKSAASALRIGEARGVVLAELARAGVPVEEITPSEVKRAVVGSGAAHKRQVQRMVTAILGLAEPPEPLDASDALAVALSLAHRTRRSARLPARQSGKRRP
jgi:crossover junction endodeoxyribonuclease RuvC